MLHANVTFHVGANETHAAIYDFIAQTPSSKSDVITYEATWALDECTVCFTRRSDDDGVILNIFGFFYPETNERMVEIEACSANIAALNVDIATEMLLAHVPVITTGSVSVLNALVRVPVPADVLQRVLTQVGAARSSGPGSFEWQNVHVTYYAGTKCWFSVDISDAGCIDDFITFIKQCAA